MKFLVAAATVLFVFATPAAAVAYVGPGAGLSLLGALWALVAALGTALVLVVAWPLRRMLRRKHASPTEVRDEQQGTGTGAEPTVHRLR